VFGLVTISSFAVAVPLVTGLIAFRRLPAPGRWLTSLMFVWLIVEAIAYSLRIEGKSNWVVYMMLSFFEIIIMTMLYQSIFKDEKAKTITTALAWVGMFIVVAEYSLVQSAENTIAMLYECVFFIGMGLYAAYEMTLAKTSLKYMFINATVIFFFLGSAIYYASWKFMERDTFMMAVIAHAYLLLVCYSLFTYGLWKLRGS
jgi:hypothetical protein